MCGILAVVGKRGGIPNCHAALETLRARGPDLTWSEEAPGLFLGQTVLSITGNPARTPGLLFNGEIYNYRALAQEPSDTLALAALHRRLPADAIPPMLDGMYAYAVVRDRELHLAVDPQGEKSLYVYEDDDLVIVASEIRAVAALVNLELDVQVLRDYFRTRHFLTFGRTAWKRVRQMLPGEATALCLDTMRWRAVLDQRLSDWIDPALKEFNAQRSMDDLADELDALLDRTAKEMVPDRPWAAVVSGGVDSSLLARYLTRHGSPVCLVAVDSVGKDWLSCDLGRFERALFHSIDTIRVTAQEYAAEIPRCIEATGGPLHSHSFVSQSILTRHVRRKGAKVLFGGEGADELFGGYDQYRLTPGISPYSAERETTARFHDDRPRVPADICRAWAQTLHPLLCDAQWQLPAVGLRSSDLMSMMWGVEARSIYVRRDVVRFALNLPRWALVDSSAPPLMRTKPLLKTLFLRYFPGLLTAKQGFAGFPNESAHHLTGAWVAPSILGVEQMPSGRDDEWKLINLEHFLRATATTPGTSIPTG